MLLRILHSGKFEYDTVGSNGLPHIMCQLRARRQYLNTVSLSPLQRSSPQKNIGAYCFDFVFPSVHLFIYLLISRSWTLKIRGDGVSAKVLSYQVTRALRMRCTFSNVMEHKRLLPHRAS